MRRISFYLNYAWSNIRRGGRWTTLAIFCIAAGVATVVALRSLGLAIGDSLIENVRIENKGDIRVIKGSTGANIAAGLSFGEDSDTFSQQERDALRNWAEARGARIAEFNGGANFQIAALEESTVGRPQFISTLLIDPQTYPPNQIIETLDPPGVPLSEVFTGAYEIVISQNMADNQNLAVGDLVSISGTQDRFTVVGIVDASYEASLRNFAAAFFGFAYMPLDIAQISLGEGFGINTISIAFDQPLTAEETDMAASEIFELARMDGFVTRIDTAVELLERNAVISQIIGDFIVIMGLGALLIGGVGIMNTMLVMVRRRTNDIAAMKTFGMKGGQVASIFFTEGLMLGVLGSVLGCIFGVLLGGIVNQYGETFLNQQLSWRIYPEAIVYGMSLGLIVTAIFSIAPILTTLQVRPGIILRPNESVVPRLGALQTIGLMIFVTIAIGLIVGQIISPSLYLPNQTGQEIVAGYTPYIVGVIGVALTLVFLGMLVMFLWVLVWMVGKLPSFGSVDLRLALRNLSTNRIRTATTLLALSSGMFALSSITFVGQGTRELLNLQLVNQFGGNVLAFPIAPGGLATSVGQFAVNNALNGVDGVTYRTIFATYDTDLYAINDQLTGNVTSRFSDDDFNPFDPAALAPITWNSVSAWDTNNPNLYNEMQTISAGRNITMEDRGQPVIVGPADSAALLGIEIGSIVSYRINGRQVDLEVIGLTSSATGGFGGGGSVMVAPGGLGQVSPQFQLYTFLVEPESVNQALVSLSSIRIPPTFAIDVSFIDSLISRFIDQFAAIPTVVGLLSLFAAAVIMANTVALSTLERRRQIGVLKAVGLKSWRVLIVMLIETTIVGLLRAILGLGLSSFFVSAFTSLSGTTIPLPADARLTAVGLLIAAVLIGWLATFLSANIAVRERVMNVLRYE